MTEELKPCPFCHRDKEVRWCIEAEITQQVKSYMAFVYCDDCGCRGPFAINIEEKFTLKHAIEKWNIR